MTTVQDVIDSACRQLGFSPNASESADAMDALNMMLAEWSATTNGIYRLVRESVTLTTGVGVYAIGPSLPVPLEFGDEYVFMDGEYLYFGTTATFDNVPPTRVLTAFVRSSDMDYPLVCYYSSQEYATIINKSARGMPSRLFYDTTFPTAAFVFYPIPDADYPFHFYSQKPLATYTSLTEDLHLPNHYAPAIKFNLAVDLSEEFGKPVSATILKRANDTLKTLKQNNSMPIPRINTDPFQASGLRFDILRGY